MNEREFSDKVKFEAVKRNLSKNNGEIHCEICEKRLSSIDECHFDHIAPYSKGGKSVLQNCQILCVSCNLRKNDKQIQDFLLEEKARRFMLGQSLLPEGNKQDVASTTIVSISSVEMTKERFDEIVKEFISRNGDIRQIDFSREFNGLASIHFVRKYYGDLNTLKKAFDIEDISLNWDREKVAIALKKFISEHGGLSQKDMTKANGLPSIQCVLRYYPECKSFTDIKRILCSLNISQKWTKESTLEAGKRFVAEHERISQNDLKGKNNLPSASTVNKLFGSLAGFQKAIGAEVIGKNEFISEQKIQEAVENLFGQNERVVTSTKDFFAVFPYSRSTVSKRYGTFEDFCGIYGIRVLKARKAKYSKQDVDSVILEWVKAGNSIPNRDQLSKLGLPSRAVILKYYEDWKEPFYLFQKICDVAQTS